jgi:hypothetical protein
MDNTKLLPSKELRKEGWPQTLIQIKEVSRGIIKA